MYMEAAICLCLYLRSAILTQMFSQWLACRLVYPFSLDSRDEYGKE